MRNVGSVIQEINVVTWKKKKKNDPSPVNSQRFITRASDTKYIVEDNFEGLNAITSVTEMIYTAPCVLSTCIITYDTRTRVRVLIPMRTRDCLGVQTYDDDGLLHRLIDYEFYNVSYKCKTNRLVFKLASVSQCSHDGQLSRRSVAHRRSIR